jgi:hypothetical protein
MHTRIAVLVFCSLAGLEARAGTLTANCYKSATDTMQRCMQNFQRSAADSGCQLARPRCLERRIKGGGGSTYLCTASSSNCSPYLHGPRTCPAGDSVVAMVNGCKHIPGGAAPVPASPRMPNVTFVCSSATAPRDCFNQLTSVLSSHQCRNTGIGCRAHREPDGTQWCEAKSSNCSTPSDGDCGSGHQVDTRGQRTLCKR